MTDHAIFALVVLSSTLWVRRLSHCHNNRKDQESYFLVDQNNEPLPNGVQTPSISNQTNVWQRATYALVMHDPPNLFYEPKEFNHTSVLVFRTRHEIEQQHNHTDILSLPSGLLRQDESCIQCMSRVVWKEMGVDVSKPENSLHHLFTFPFDREGMHLWADFMECVYRGSLEDLYETGIPCESIASVSLCDIQEMIAMQLNISKEASTKCATIAKFTPDSLYALQLFLQRQLDLRAKRRLLKGYSSTDLEHYHLRKENKIIFLDEKDSKRTAALNYTMQTDDGQSPSLLFEADAILLGVSRVGKTPLSLLLSQTMGIKVANVPLVVDMAPPPQLLKVNPRRVFCLTICEEQLQALRKNRLRREISKTNLRAYKNTYADLLYVRKDLEYAQRIASAHGFTEIDVSGRAFEETAHLIASKLRERFPNTDIG